MPNEEMGCAGGQVHEGVLGPWLGASNGRQDASRMGPMGLLVEIAAAAAGPKLSYGVVSGVNSSGWTTVTLGQT